MDRRTFCSLTAGALFSSGMPPKGTPNANLRFTNTQTGVGPFVASGHGRSPHILMISADMVGPDLYHPTRSLSQHVHLPAIRSLMQDGVFFTNAFCTVPLCSPSRASYLTGRYSYVLGNGERSPQGLETQLRADDIIFPEYLKAAGYVTRQVGKCHVGADKFLDAFGGNDQPWDQWSPPVFQDDDFLAYQRNLDVKPQKYSREIVFNMQDRTTPGNSVGGWIVQEDGKPFPIEAQFSYYLGKKVVDTVESLISNGSLQHHPMYLQLDIFDPHQPFSIPAGFEERERELRKIMTVPASWKTAQERNFQRAPDEPEIIDIYRRYWGIYDPQKLIDYRIAYILQMEPMWSLYAQDQYRVTPRLTLNYGLRWELNGPYYDINGTLPNFDPAFGSWVVPDRGLKYINPRYPTNIPITTTSNAGYPGNGLVNMRKLNFYPRIGVAYQPFPISVIRAAFGIYGVPVYGGLARSSSITGGPFSGTSYFNNAIKNGAPLFSFPQPFLSAGTTSTQTAMGVTPNLVTPSTQQWNVTWEQQVGETALRLSYIGSRGVNLIRVVNLNQPAPSLTPFTPSERTYPIFSNITWLDNGGSENYNALEIAVAKNYGKNLTFNAGWTWAKDLTNAQDTGSYSSQMIQNRFNPGADYGNTLLTPTHRVFGYAVYQLPFGRDQRFLNASSRLTEGFLGGWQMAWNVLLQSGQFFTPSYAGFDSSNTNTIGGRPDLVPGVSSKPVGKQSITNWFNPAAFKIPGCPDNNPVCAHPADVGRFGNSSIGILRGPAIYNADLALSKYFALYGRTRLQVQSTMVDVFNHPSFALPASNISASGSVGRITTQIAPSLGTAVGRQITFALRLEF